MRDEIMIYVGWLVHLLLAYGLYRYKTFLFMTIEFDERKLHCKYHSFFLLCFPCVLRQDLYVEFQISLNHIEGKTPYIDLHV
jgi:hypothetical protein